MIGVSIMAIKTLKANPLKNSFPKTFQGSISKEHNNNKTVKVSTACEVIVEKLLRSHNFFP